MKSWIVLVAALGVAGAAAAHQGKGERRGRHRGEHMAKLDTDGDQRVSRSEFLAKLGPFERADANKDGVVEKSEVESIERERMRERALDWLERADGNHDGKVSSDEARTAREEAFKRLDRDGDGFLTREDRRKAHESKDKDKDKQI